MLQFPAFMTQFPSTTTTIPTSFWLPSQLSQPHSEELFLSVEESNLEQKLNEIRDINRNLVVIGKTTADNDKEDNNDADDDDTDNAEESEGEEFEQTG
ncbi:hypothetical protein DITRI_Ditri04bG0001600 [Diplodiscus trichospermus]